jgi:hypothetical protein
VLEKISSSAIGKASGDTGRGYERSVDAYRMQDIGDLKPRVSVSLCPPHSCLAQKLKKSGLLCMLLFFGGRSSCDRQQHETQQGEADRQQGVLAQNKEAARCQRVPGAKE